MGWLEGPPSLALRRVKIEPWFNTPLNHTKIKQGIYLALFLGVARGN